MSVHTRSIRQEFIGESTIPHDCGPGHCDTCDVEMVMWLIEEIAGLEAALETTTMPDARMVLLNRITEYKADLASDTCRCGGCGRRP